MIKTWLLVIFLTSVNAPLMAAGRGEIYGGIQYAPVTYDRDFFEEAKPTALVVRLGGFVNDFFAIEGRFGAGKQDDTIHQFGIGVDVEVDSLSGIYGVFQQKYQSETSIYGVVGYSKVEIDSQVEFEGLPINTDVDADESGFSFGFGVNIGWLNIEYMRYLSKNDFDATAISLGIVHQF